MGKLLAVRDERAAGDSAPRVASVESGAASPAVASPRDIRAAEIARGLTVKRNNAVTATLTGGMFAIGAAKLYGFGRHGVASREVALAFLPGVAAGFLYANAFEYALHRFVLHWGDGFLVQRHALHHDSAGAPEEARYVNFATSPWVVALVFVLNAPLVFAAGRILNGAAAAGIAAGFTCYFVAYEEIHWRIHFGGWLPGWLGFARRHHMLHHGGRKGRNNVFLPIFDWIFQRAEWKEGAGKPDAARHRQRAAG